MLKHSRLRSALRVLFLGLSAMVLLFCVPAGVRGYVLFTSPTGLPYAWDLSKGPVNWTITPGAPTFTLACAEACTQQWVQASGNALQTQQGPGGVTVTWDYTGTQIVDPLFLAYTIYSVDSSGHMASAQITVNGYNYVYHWGEPRGVTYTSAGPVDVDLGGVLLHEFGHSFGMSHSDLDPAAIVGTVGPDDYPTMNSVIYPGAEALHPDDIAGIRVLYPDGGPPVPSPSLDIQASPLKGKAPISIFFSSNLQDPNTQWTFGDGTSAVGATVEHKFTYRGSYTVTASSSGTSASIAVALTGRKAPRPKPQKK